MLLLSSSFLPTHTRPTIIHQHQVDHPPPQPSYKEEDGKNLAETNKTKVPLTPPPPPPTPSHMPPRRTNHFLPDDPPLNLPSPSSSPSSSPSIWLSTTYRQRRHPPENIFRRVPPLFLF